MMISAMLRSLRSTRYRAHRQIRFGPLRLNFTQNGLSSWGFGWGRLSWNSRTDRITYDTPGPGRVSAKRPRRNPRTQTPRTQKQDIS